MDLDLFGAGSLFELLSTARTGDGEEELAGWLLSSAQPDVITERQQAVSELGPAVILRESMAVAGHTVRIAADTRGLRKWASQETAPGLQALRVTTYTAALAVAAATTALAVTGNLLALEIVFVLQLAARYGQGSHLERILQVAESVADCTLNSS